MLPGKPLVQYSMVLQDTNCPRSLHRGPLRFLRASKHHPRTPHLGLLFGPLTPTTTVKAQSPSAGTVVDQCVMRQTPPTTTRVRVMSMRLLEDDAISDLGQACPSLLLVGQLRLPSMQ